MASQGLRAAEPPAKGEPPARVPPLTPSCASLAQGAFRALRRASMGSAPGPRPLFCKKAGQKTFTGLDFRQPKPLAPGASDTIRPRSGHLSGRVAPPTRVGEAGGPRNLTGAPPPHKRFSLGLHPVSLGKTKEMGWIRQHQRKVQQTAKRRVPETQRPGGPGPRPYRSSGPPAITPSSRQRGGKRRSGGGVSGAAGR